MCSWSLYCCQVFCQYWTNEQEYIYTSYRSDRYGSVLVCQLPPKVRVRTAPNNLTANDNELDRANRTKHGTGPKRSDQTNNKDSGSWTELTGNSIGPDRAKPSLFLHRTGTYRTFNVLHRTGQDQVEPLFLCTGPDMVQVALLAWSGPVRIPGEFAALALDTWLCVYTQILLQHRTPDDVLK